MNLTLGLLRRYVDLPEDPREARVLLDEVGLEVKRIDPSDPDVPLTLELLANRGDHHGLLGVATEIRGRTGASLRFPDPNPLQVGPAPRPVVVEDDRCPVYTLTRLVRAQEGVAVPEQVRALLKGCGLDPVHPVVDATNAVLKEIGQPTHAFDADKVVGTIRVRAARAGEQAWPLFAPAPVAVPEGALVIADEVKILAIAGVIGCEDSATTPDTREVLLESAAFDPVSVRKTSRAMGIHTDSSARFERGSDFSAPLRGAGRVVGMLEATGWEAQGPTGVHSTWRDPRRSIPFDGDAARRFLAIEESDAQLVERLRRYGLHPIPDAEVSALGEPVRPGGIRILVPPHRLWDVAHPADLYEELARSIGYDNTPEALPPVDLGAVPTEQERARERAAEVLVGAGFFETITDGFHGRDLPEALGFVGSHPLSTHVETANAIDRAYSLLKNQCLGQALLGLSLNARHGEEDVKLFEFTRTFHPDQTAANGVCRERRVLWAIATGRQDPVSWEPPVVFGLRDLQGVVEELAFALRVPLRVASLEPDLAPLSTALHPGRRAGIFLQDRLVGLVGEVHPQVRDAFKIKRGRPVYLELEVGALEAPAAPWTFEEPPRVAPVERALAFVLPEGPEGLPAGEVQEVIARVGGPALASVRASERFSLGPSEVVWTFELRWHNPTGDITADQLNDQTERAAAAVVEALGAAGVRRRS